MKNKDDKEEPIEKCSVCGKEFKEGEGRFRTGDQVFCVECYYRHHPHLNDSEEEQEGIFRVAILRKSGKGNRSDSF